MEYCEPLYSDALPDRTVCRIRAYKAPETKRLMAVGITISEYGKSDTVPVVDESGYE